MGCTFRGLLFLLASSLVAEQTFTVSQLLAFLRSSIELKQPDKEVAQYVARMKLSQRLDERTVEQLQGEGLGPKTVAALKTLSASSTSLSAPVEQPAAPKPVPIPPPSYEDQQDIIRDMTEYALNYTKRLPDFVCTQVTRRYADPRMHDSWISVDTVTAKVSYVEGHENYELKLVNSTPILEKKSLDSLGGAVSTGEFGSMMKEIFEPETGTEFHWVRWGTLRGRRVHVFSYEVEQSRSKYSIDWERKMRIIAAYKGLIYVEKDSHKIVRITTEAVNIPATFPVREVSSFLDYDYQEIGPRQFLLPLKSETRMRDSQVAMKNDLEFRLYRKFGADTTIKYDEVPEPLPESQTTETPPQPAPPIPPK